MSYSNKTDYYNNNHRNLRNNNDDSFDRGTSSIRYNSQTRTTMLSLFAVIMLFGLLITFTSVSISNAMNQHLRKLKQQQSSYEASSQLLHQSLTNMILPNSNINNNNNNIFGPEDNNSSANNGNQSSSIRWITMPNGHDFYGKIAEDLNVIVHTERFFTDDNNNVNYATTANELSPEDLDILHNTFGDNATNSASGAGVSYGGSQCFAVLATNMRWFSQNNQFVVHTAGIEDACLSLEFINCSIISAINAYQSRALFKPFSTSIQWDIGGTDSLSRNNKNDISFGEIPLPDSSSILAMTTFFWFSNNTLSEADIVFNTKLFRYGNVDQSLYQQMIDFLNILTHELCHTYGVIDQYGVICIDSTFYGYSSYRDVKKRSLTLDDQSGYVGVYGGTIAEQSDVNTCSNLVGQVNSSCLTIFYPGNNNNQSQQSTSSTEQFLASNAANPLRAFITLSTLSFLFILCVFFI